MNYPNTHIGRSSIFLERKKRSNAGVKRGPRWMPHNTNLFLTNSAAGSMALPVPRGGYVATGNVNHKGRPVQRSGRGKIFVFGSTGRRIYTVHMEKPARKTRSNKNVKRGPRYFPRNTTLFTA